MRCPAVVISIVAAAVVAAPAAYSQWGAGDGEPDAARSGAPTERTNTVPDRPPVAGVPIPTPSAAPGAKLLELPDGTKVAPLNGVKAPATMAWGEGPFSPIVGTERGSGYDWYVHADGSHTTTIEVWREELGRLDAVTLVYRATDAPPAEIGR